MAAVCGKDKAYGNVPTGLLDFGEKTCNGAYMPASNTAMRYEIGNNGKAVECVGWVRKRRYWGSTSKTGYHTLYSRYFKGYVATST